MDKLEKLSEIDQILALEVAQRHSYFQLKYFLIGKEPTNQAKMWQCLRELKARKDTLDNIALEIEEIKDNLELLDISLNKIKIETEENFNEYPNFEEPKLQTREIEIKIKQTERKKLSLKNNLGQLEQRKKWTEEELIFFLETFKSIRNIEPLKNFDDLESQKQYWGEKLSRKVNLKMLTNSQLDTEMLETVMALPDDVSIKQETINTLNLRKKQMINQLNDAMKQIEEKSKEN